MENKLSTLRKLFFTFLKIGAFTFGGGYAMIPLIQKETVENNKWISDEEILEVIAISESTPGPISVNAATFIGCRVAGFWGAFVSTFGLIFPAFIIMFVISTVLRNFYNNEIVQYMFFGIRAGVLALVFNALVKMFKKIDKTIFSCFIIVFSFSLVVFFDINSIIVIVLCAIIGIIVSMLNVKEVK